MCPTMLEATMGLSIPPLCAPKPAAGRGYPPRPLPGRGVPHGACCLAVFIAGGRRLLACSSPPPSIMRAARWEFTRLSPTFPASSGASLIPRLATANLYVGAEARRGAHVCPLKGERHDGAGWGTARCDLEPGEDSSVPIPDERPQGPCGGRTPLNQPTLSQHPRIALK